MNMIVYVAPTLNILHHNLSFVGIIVHVTPLHLFVQSILTSEEK